MKRIIFSIILIGLSVIMVEVSIRAVTFLRPWGMSADLGWKALWLRENLRPPPTGRAYRNDSYLRHHPTRGWTVRADLSDFKAFPGKKINTDRLGLRFTRDRNQVLQTTNLQGKMEKIAILGDSFTFGDDLEDSETYAYKLQKMNVDQEVMNFGVSGYGLDQMVLTFEESVFSLKPRVVLFALYRDDFFRSTLGFRSSQKPRFHLADGILQLKNVPCPEPAQLWMQEMFMPFLFQLPQSIFRMVQLRSGSLWEQTKGISSALMKRVVDLVKPTGIRVGFVYLPDKADLESPNSKEDEFFIAEGRRLSIPYLSLRGVFQTEMAGGFSMREGHWGEAESEIAAKVIQTFLLREFP